MSKQKRNKGLYTSLVNEEEFQESDVWGSDSQERRIIPNRDSSSSSTSILRRNLVQSATKMIPKSSHKNTIINHHHHNSAPINIPDWSKIYGNNNNNNNNNNNSNGFVGDFESEEDEDDGDGDGGSRVHMVPPHEWLARKLARTQISSFSVCEGVGRTLKGRDLSRVRNAVLTKTGFLE